MRGQYTYLVEPLVSLAEHIHKVGKLFRKRASIAGVVVVAECAFFLKV